MLEILVARVEVVPKVIPLIIIHKPVVALARHTRALHGTRVRVRDGRRSDQWIDQYCTVQGCSVSTESSQVKSSQVTKYCTGTCTENR